MDDLEEANEIRKLIQSDEELLARKRKEEIAILDHVSSVGFSATNSRENLLSQMQEIEDRLYKNRVRLGGR